MGSAKKPKDENKQDKKGKKEAASGAKPQGKKPHEKKRASIVRIMETNVNGDKPVYPAINSIKGIAPMFGKAVAGIFGSHDKKVMDLTEKEIDELENIIENPAKYNIPSWLFNRRRDPETGEDKHLAVSALMFSKTMDINNLKKLRCYKGVRHMFGLPVRGQRTRGSFRKGKSVGVSRKKQQPAKK